MVSASRRWLIDTIMPTDIQVPMTLLTGTFIIVASSLTVTNSVSFSVLLSAACSCISSLRRSCTASRFSRRYFAPFLFWLLVVSLASVSFTWRATSSSLTSTGLGWLRFLRLRLPPWLSAFTFSGCRPPWLLFPPWLLPLFFFLPPPCCCAAASMSTRSFPMRTLFLRSFPPRCCWAFSSRSFFRSSLDFFLGRVLWLSASRSIFPSTFTLGASLDSLLRVKMRGLSLFCTFSTASACSPLPGAASAVFGFSFFTSCLFSGLFGDTSFDSLPAPSCCLADSVNSFSCFFPLSSLAACAITGPLLSWLAVLFSVLAAGAFDSRSAVVVVSASVWGRRLS